MNPDNDEVGTVIYGLRQALQECEAENLILAAKNVALQSKLDRVREMVARYFHAQYTLRGEARFSKGEPHE